jgi:hypothetical protein
MGLTVSDIVKSLMMGKLECLTDIFSAEEALENDAKMVAEIVAVIVTRWATGRVCQRTHGGWAARMEDLI